MVFMKGFARRSYTLFACGMTTLGYFYVRLAYMREYKNIYSSRAEVMQRHQLRQFISDGFLDANWVPNVCTNIKDLACHHVIVLRKNNVTFCSAAKVASTTIRNYFYQIDGDLSIPVGAKFGVHEANWTRLADIDPSSRIELLKSSNWTHVFFMRNVVERFISGYLDKVVNDCRTFDLSTNYPTLGPLNHYTQYGFSCDKHSDLEAFVAFMESVPHMEGHFAPQTPLCNFKKFPYTDIVFVDDDLSIKLQRLSVKLGVKHPLDDPKTSSHKTGARFRIANLLNENRDLIRRILKIFKEDCEVLPASCKV